MENYYNYKYVDIDEKNKLHVKEEKYKIKINPVSKKLGVMLVGMGGNNGSTFVASLLAYKLKVKWENKNGLNSVDFLGSLYQYGNINIGYKNSKPYTKLMRELVTLYNPEDIVISGWDINKDNIYESCLKNKVLDFNLLNSLKDDLEKIKPLSSVYDEKFIATNQKSRANNLKEEKNKKDYIDSIQIDITNFKHKNKLDKVIVVWTASTERFNEGNWNTMKDLENSILENDPEISPSILFAIAAIRSNCIFINGSPQNTIGPSILEMAKKYKTFVGGEDFKTGQTKLKSVLVDFLASSGIKPLSIVSYNHLGNNDGLNLDETPQFLSKEITKRNVIDDIVDENPKLFTNRKPEHCVVIKYIKAVGDSKRAMDEYHSELFLDGRSNIVIHNTCEDTLLAVPLILDIIIFSEFFSRITFKKEDINVGVKNCDYVDIENILNYKEVPFSPNLSLLSFFFKAPVEDGNPIVNAFFKQKYGLENFIKACVGLPINDFLNIHTKI